MAAWELAYQRDDGAGCARIVREFDDRCLRVVGKVSTEHMILITWLLRDALDALERRPAPDAARARALLLRVTDNFFNEGISNAEGVLAYIFAGFCIMGSFGGGNMFQANQCFAAIKAQIPALEGGNASLIFGVALAAAVGLVIIGGIKSIGRVTEKIIPAMCGIYLVAGVVVIIANIGEVPKAVGLIFEGAFTPSAAFGGFIGVLVQGVKRAVFSNEAGVGSAAIAHSAAKTDEPAREGMVAMLGPFIDTVVICAMTGVILVVSGAYAAPDVGTGVEMTRFAFEQTMGWFPWVMVVLVATCCCLCQTGCYGFIAWRLCKHPGDYFYSPVGAHDPSETAKFRRAALTVLLLPLLALCAAPATTCENGPHHRRLPLQPQRQNSKTTFSEDSPSRVRVFFQQKTPELHS